MTTPVLKNHTSTLMNVFWAAVSLIWHEKEKKREGKSLIENRKELLHSIKRWKKSEIQAKERENVQTADTIVKQKQIFTIQFKLQPRLGISEILTTSKGLYLYG